MQCDHCSNQARPYPVPGKTVHLCDRHVVTIVPTARIGFLVDRLHVATSKREVIRDLRRRLLSSGCAGRPSRTLRHLSYRFALERHAENMDTYRVVMGGI